MGIAFSSELDYRAASECFRMALELDPTIERTRELFIETIQLTSPSTQVANAPTSAAVHRHDSSAPVTAWSQFQYANLGGMVGVGVGQNAPIRRQYSAEFKGIVDFKVGGRKLNSAKTVNMYPETVKEQPNS